MKTIGKKIIVYIAGWMFIVLGVLGLFLPVLQGILFLIIGLTFLSSEYVWAHRLLKKAKGRFPAVANKCEELSNRAKHWLHKRFPHTARTGVREGRP